VVGKSIRSPSVAMDLVVFTVMDIFRAAHRPVSGVALALLLVAAFWGGPALTADSHQLAGRVVRIVDGDTLVLEVSGARYRVRLAGIDAPERNQLWGEAATRELRRMLAGRAVVVEWHKRDRWKRLIGVVKLSGEDTNLHMVDRGLAWHYKRYAAEQAATDREAYSTAESAAQEARRGLWSDPEPIPPWEWRRR
jgi:endonuclease YncB( thermonuclease family)